MIHKSNSESSFDSSASEAEAGKAKKSSSASRFKVENVDKELPDPSALAKRRPSTVYPQVLNPKVGPDRKIVYEKA